MDELREWRDGKNRQRAVEAAQMLEPDSVSKAEELPDSEADNERDESSD